MAVAANGRFHIKIATIKVSARTPGIIAVIKRCAYFYLIICPI
jgi:hypothetical protein